MVYYADATAGYSLEEGSYAAPEEQAAAPEVGCTVPAAVHGEICSLYSKAMQRLEAVGAIKFFGDECALFNSQRIPSQQGQFLYS
jgi:hypothetical protein